MAARDRAVGVEPWDTECAAERATLVEIARVVGLTDRHAVHVVRQLER